MRHRRRVSAIGGLSISPGRRRLALQLAAMGTPRLQLIDFDVVEDLRRSCITNWAKELPAHVAQRLAGHSSLETTVR